jgi:hypothetical protein
LRSGGGWGLLLLTDRSDCCRERLHGGGFFGRQKTSSAKPGFYKITWFDKQARTQNSFEQDAKVLSDDELQKLWYDSHYQFSIGEKLYRFLDGDGRFLDQALAKGQKEAEEVILQLATCPGTENWPFELVAKGASFLLMNKVHIVRCVSDWGAEPGKGSGEFFLSPQRKLMARIGRRVIKSFLFLPCYDIM